LPSQGADGVQDIYFTILLEIFAFLFTFSQYYYPYYLQYLLCYYVYLLFIYCALFALGRRPEEEEREE
jgi:hypothetical protein